MAQRAAVRDPYPLARIICDPRIQAGAPVVRGTRVTVRAIAAQHRAGIEVAQIRESYPHLLDEDVHAALAYYAAHRAEVDAELDAEWRGQE